MSTNQPSPASQQRVYANENDPHAAHWLSCLPLQIDRIDDRSIEDVKGTDLEGFTQCHFFAGIAGWPYALELAGWPVDAPAWTGSCPCQPFSSAGKRKGTADDRHLWPEFLRLVAECSPPVIFGEQVASKLGREWLSGVRLDLEALGYAVGAADLCAAGAGAPHIRQRLFWVAYGGGKGLARWSIESAWQEFETPERSRDAGGMANANSNGRNQGRISNAEARDDGTVRDSSVGRMGDTERSRSLPGSLAGVHPEKESSRARDGESERSGSKPTATGQWRDAEYIPCIDGKARPVKPGVRLLAHGIPGRVAQLRGLGNAIVPQVAATFVRSFIESSGIVEASS